MELHIKKAQATHYVYKGDETYSFKVYGGLVTVIGYNHVTSIDFFRNQMTSAQARAKWKELLNNGFIHHTE